MQRGKEGSQAKHLSTAEYKAKKIIEEAEEIRRENQVYADALEEAKKGEIPKKRGKLQEQVIALTVANKDLTERLDRSMQDTLDMVKENKKIKAEQSKDVKYAQVGKYIAINAPNLCRNILNGEISTVIVKDMSRLGRDHILVGYYTKYYFPDADVRFIAIYDQMDTETNPDDDIIPFKNILNEMYEKDCSRKIKAVVKAKGNSGRHLTTIPSLGYMKDSEDKEKWIVDEKGALIVKEIFNLCVKGYGPIQIARILTERGIETPSLYLHRKKLPCSVKLNQDSDVWDYTTVVHILENEEYLGHTVNFRYYKKSYKSKKRCKNPRENWAIFENTQEAIIDQDTFDIVQQVRAGRRR